VDDPLLDELPLDEPLPEEPLPLDELLLEDPLDALLDEPLLDEAVPLDEPDEALLDEPLLDEALDEPLLDEALPLDVEEPKPDDPSSVTPPESGATPALPSRPGKSPMPRSEPHAVAPRHNVSAIGAASRV
jgi:hypothetical protein